MAIMIPSKPLDVEKRSGEDRIFEILKNKLPDDAYVAHSFEIRDQHVKSGDIYECEIDFLVIIPHVGCLIIESKNAQIYPERGTGLTYKGETFDYLWHLPNGETMKYNGPFRQAERSKRLFDEYLKEGRASKFGYTDRVTLTHCVLLPLISQSAINAWNLPADAGNVKFILSRDDLESKDPGHLYKRICEIIGLQKSKPYACLDEEGTKGFIKAVIAPECHLVPSEHFFVDLQNERLNSFLHQQLVILDFMEEQNIAVIGGGAGTGKTMIAIEKARRLSKAGKKVLFLCFNKKLKEHLASEYKDDNVRYETIDSLFYSYFKCEANGNYGPLSARIESDYEKGVFPYRHFVIDEAQDMGRKDIEGSRLLEYLQGIAEMNEDDACCYYFYDRYQLVQSKEIPSVIQKADCKMTLYKNCRNTERIASTSYKVFTKEELSKRDVKGFEAGTFPKAANCLPGETYEVVAKMVDKLRAIGYKDIVILSAKEDGGSALSQKAKGEALFFNGFRCAFTTCRKFKGLEAEAIILVDVDGGVLLNPDKRLLFYVGASRAKFDLNIVFNLSDDECKTIIQRSEYPSFSSSKNFLFTLFETDIFKA